MKALQSGPVLMALVSAIVIAAIAAGLWLIGSPKEQRIRRIDGRRLGDLQSIERQIDVYWTRHEALPESLQALQGEPGLAPAPIDPVRGEPYSYRLLDEDSYELCAVFDTVSRDPELWAHEKGPACFRFDVKGR
jgi:hypothetical protein